MPSRIKCRECGAESYADGDTGLVCIRCHEKLKAEIKSQAEHIKLLQQCDDTSTETIAKMDHEIERLEAVIDNIAIHTMHMLWILDSENHKDLRHFFDSFPRGLLQHVGEIQSHCAESGSKIAQTGKIEDEGETCQNKPE